MVDPSVALVDHHVVELSGSGFRPEAILVIEQCPASAPDGACDSNRHDVTLVRDDGTISKRVGLSAVVTGAGQTLDCRQALGACEIRVVRFSGSQLAAAPLEYDPSAPLDRTGRVSLEPDDDLIDGQLVTLSADHLRPLALIAAYVCSAEGSECQRFISTDDAAGEMGVLTTPFRIRAMLVSESGHQIDCRVTPCTINVAENPFTDAPTSVPLRLDPDADLAPAPTIAIEPASHLAPEDTVQVQGSGWFSGDLVVLRECLHDPVGPPEHCTIDNSQVFTADAVGRFSRATVVTAVGRTTEGTLFDCRRQACDLVAFRGNTGGSEYAAVALSFEEEGSSPLGPSPGSTPPTVIEPQFTG